MALEKFNNTTKSDIHNFWYKNVNRAFLRHVILDIQEEFDIPKTQKNLGHHEIQKLVQIMGKPDHIKNKDFTTYVNYRKLLGHWE